MISESVVIISDLHLGDARKSAEYEQRQLLKLGRLLQEIQPTLVLNLGDTVSRPEYLRPGLKTAGLFADYLRWRKSTGFPFMECMIEREKNFFEEVFHQSPDDFRRISDRLAVIALAPTENNDHAFRREQLTWLQKQLKEFSGSYVLIGTHVPFEGACSRPAEPGNYLERTPELDRMIREARQQIFWAGGHFHWAPEPVSAGTGFCPFLGGCFAFEKNPKPHTYLRCLRISDNGAAIEELPWSGE